MVSYNTSGKIPDKLKVNSLEETFEYQSYCGSVFDDGGEVFGTKEHRLYLLR
jgi:hypothetical protein